jgi:hypothetical protein
MPAMPIYPAQIDNATSLPVVIDLITPITGSTTNILRAAILQIEMTLGVQPASTYGTVAARLNALESGSVSFAGDLSGTSVSQTVIGLQTIPINNIRPVSNQVLQYNGSTWGPGSLLPGFIAGGDLSGSSTDQTVIGIQGIPVSSTAPTSGQVLEYNGSQYIPTSITATLAGDVVGPIGGNTVAKIQGSPVATTSPTASSVLVWDITSTWSGGPAYDVRPLTQDDILAGFSINSFSGGSTVEIGATVSNPAFTASYSHTPNSAQITNTDGIDSPLVLSSPYTSGTVVGSFHHTSQATVSFTLSATYTSTKTAGASINFYPRMFAGVGGAGASSATASGTNAILNSSLGTLASIGVLSSLAVGTLISFSPTAQKLYVLATGGSHSFVDNSNNLPFPFNSPTNFIFTNINSSMISMYLYESTNTLTGSFTLKVSA